MFSNVPRGGVYYSTGGTVLGRPTVLDAYWSMAGSCRGYALISSGELGVTRVSRNAVFGAQGGSE